MTRFRDGQTVRILDLPIRGHIRTPHYVRGKTGTIERFCGAWPNPEGLAYGEDGLPARELYRVRLAQSALWGTYRGRRDDTLEIEIYDHWLEPVDPQEAVQ